MLKKFLPLVCVGFLAVSFIGCAPADDAADTSTDDAAASTDEGGSDTSEGGEEESEEG